MKVFLSSTYIDLTEYRNKATQAIERLNHQVRRMEVFGARSTEPQIASLGEVDACDIFVGIYAHRYGYKPPHSDISITEAEFRHAKSAGKAILCFVIDDEYPWPPRMVEHDPGMSSLSAFKTEISPLLVTEKFTTPDDLALKVGTSVALHISESFAPLVSGLRDVIENNSGGSPPNRQAVDDALSAVIGIANRTFRYMASRRRLEPTNLNEEAELSQGWKDAGLKLRALPTPPTDLIDRYFQKSQYWADPDLWTAERVEGARIRLTQIEEESRNLLLGIQLPNN